MWIALVFSLLFVLAWWALRHRPGRETLSVIGRCGLGSRSGLALIECDGARLLIGHGEGAPVILARWDEAPASTRQAP